MCHYPAVADLSQGLKVSYGCRSCALGLGSITECAHDGAVKNRGPCACQTAADRLIHLCHSPWWKSLSEVNRNHGKGKCIMRLKSFSLMTSAVVSLVAAGPSLAQQPIPIGASIAISGRDAVQGGYVREGYLLCQKHVNEKGGVLGRPK